MSYESPFDQLRQEVRAGTTGVVRFWPKVSGEGNVTATSATFSVRDHNGNVTLSNQSATIVAVTDVGSRIDCPVSAADLEVEQGLQVEVLWQTAGDSSNRFDSVAFDVVKYPFSQSTIGYSDILDERPEAIDVLAHLAERVGKTPQQYASVIGYHARVALDGMLRDSVAGYSASYPTVPFLRGHLILDRDRLKRIELKLAMRELYARTMTGSPDEDDPSRALHDYYAAEADTAWRQVGTLRFDVDEDGQPDLIAEPSGGTIHLERHQA